MSPMRRYILSPSTAQDLETLSTILFVFADSVGAYICSLLFYFKLTCFLLRSLACTRFHSSLFSYLLSVSLLYPHDSTYVTTCMTTRTRDDCMFNCCKQTTIIKRVVWITKEIRRVTISLSLLFTAAFLVITYFTPMVFHDD